MALSRDATTIPILFISNKLLFVMGLFFKFYFDKKDRFLSLPFQLSQAKTQPTGYLKGSGEWKNATNTGASTSAATSCG